MSLRVMGDGDQVRENEGQITMVVTVGTADMVGVVRVGVSTIPITAKGEHVQVYTTQSLNVSYCDECIHITQRNWVTL